MIERTFVEQGMKKIQLEQFFKEHLDKAGFTGLEIVKTPLVTRITLNTARPGLAIGKSGQNIKQLTLEIGKRFGIENPQIEIRDIKNPELDAKATVDKMIGLIERGYSWRSVAFKAVQDIMAAGAQGVELILKGKLSGKGGRKRKLRIAQGYMKKVGNDVKKVDYAKGSAYPKAGAIGIKLRIIHPGVVFSDKVNVEEVLDKRESGEAQVVASTQPVVAAATVAEEAVAKDRALVVAETGVVEAVAARATQPLVVLGADAVEKVVENEMVVPKKMVPKEKTSKEEARKKAKKEEKKEVKKKEKEKK